MADENTEIQNNGFSVLVELLRSADKKENGGDGNYTVILDEYTKSGIGQKIQQATIAETSEKVKAGFSSVLYNPSEDVTPDAIKNTASYVVTEEITKVSDEYKKLLTLPQKTTIPLDVMLKQSTGEPLNITIETLMQLNKDYTSGLKAVLEDIQKIPAEDIQKEIDRARKRQEEIRSKATDDRSLVPQDNIMTTPSVPHNKPSTDAGKNTIR